MPVRIKLITNLKEKTYCIKYFQLRQQQTFLMTLLIWELQLRQYIGLILTDFTEVNRVSKKKGEGGRIAVWCYAMHKISPRIDKITERLDADGDILGEFWPNEIKYIK